MERKAIDPNNSTNSSLEKFMAKLCSHHQKQFILVLNNICTEESMKSKSRSASVSEIENANLEYHDHSCCEKKANPSLVEINKSISESCVNGQVCINISPALLEDDYRHEMSHCSNYLSEVPISSGSKEDHAVKVSYATDQTITNNPEGVSGTEENTGTIIAKISEVDKTVSSEHCVRSPSNSTLNMSNDSLGSEHSTNIPKIANKESAQCINPKPTFLDCTDCKLKQENSLTTVTVKKLGNLSENPFQNLTDHCGSTLQKVRLHENKRLKTAKCKNSRVLLTNDCDKQCDVVYISEPITTECHFENHKSVVCTRNTARKSTRGYLFNGDCCELSTVRTLVRSSKTEEKGNSALHIAEALIIPNGLIETLPSTDVVSLIHLEEKRVESDTCNLSEEDEMRDLIPDSSRIIEPENPNPSPSVAKEPVDHVSNSLIAVFSLAQDEPDKLGVSSNHTAHEQSLNQHVESIPKTKLDSSVANKEAHSLSEIEYEKNIAKPAIDSNFAFSHSSNSCSQEERSPTQSLDMEVIVSLKNNHLLCEYTSPECDPYNTAMEEASATLQCSHSGSSTGCSTSHRTADKDLPIIGSSSLNDSKILPVESSEAVIADSVAIDHQLSVPLSSQSVPDVLPKETSESQISKSSQVNHGDSDSPNEFHEHSEKYVVKENKHLIDLEIEIDNCQSLGPNDSTEMETNANILQETLDAAKSTEHLTICAKSVGNNNGRLEASVSEEAHHCDTVSSSGCIINDLFTESLETKEFIGESSTGAVNLDKMDDSSASNIHFSNPLTPSKRHKKVPAPTDRCLRSREAHGNSVLQKSPSLQVLLSYDTDTNLAHRSVVLRTEDTPCSGTIVSLFDETSDSENHFAVSLNSHSEEGRPLFYERVLKNVCMSPYKMSENLKVYFTMGSDKRIISFAEETHNFQNEEKYGATSLTNTCQSKLESSNKSQSENVTNSSSRARSCTKHVALTSLKDKMKYCKSDKIKNQPTGSKQMKGLNKEKNRPKFIEWCSEEENQERISNFNDKYSAIHKNWISLERETVNVSKSKNKADKLKEIWKTKKRVRRPKSIQDTPKCSPMQMLFMNSSKFSDICKWFMETTETKSLVIVKKLNTRLPEEHQLPMMQSPKYSSQSLYPYILQAQRLKKHLKKFASIIPARNDIDTQNSLNKLISNNSVPLNQITKDTVKGPNDCKKQEPHVKPKKTAPVHILKKYNRLRGSLKYQSSTVHKNKVCMTNKAKSKSHSPENTKAMCTSDLSMQKVRNSLTAKSLIVKNKNSKKRNTSDSLSESLAQPNKKRKIEAKQGFFKNGCINKNSVSTKTKVSKLSKVDSTSRSKAPKKQAKKTGVLKTSVMKAKAKTPMQKQSFKSQLVLKRQTRSAKQKQVSSNVSDSPKITSLSSTHRKKELSKKIHTVSAKNKRNVVSQVRHRRHRSQLEPSTRKGR